MNDSVSIGDAVRRAREDAGLSQKQLAQLMREADYKWSQATVWSIESGSRDLRWSEGVTLRTAIGFSSGPLDAETIRDAAAYRRILSVIGERKAQGVA